MLFTLRKHDDEQKSHQSEETWKIIIDVKNRTFSRKRTSSETTGDAHFAEAFISHLTEAHWNVFYCDLVDQRSALLDDAKALKSAYFDFSDLEHSIEHESAMVFYDTVFPFGMPIDLEVRGTRVSLIDQYCLNSRCSCTDVALTAFHAIASVDTTDDTPVKPLYTVSYNYQTHAATVIDDFGADSTQAAARGEAGLFLQALKADLKRISAGVKKRHRMMRNIYEAYRIRTDAHDGDRHDGPAETIIPPAVHGSPPPPIGGTGVRGSDLPHGKVGRNQACPCGSGRKYKHCCGR